MTDEPIHVVAADLVRGDLLIYFSDGTTTLFHGPFLYSVRKDDGNVPVDEKFALDESEADLETGEPPKEPNEAV